MELWDLSTTNATFLNDVSLLDNAAQYRSCVTDNFRSAVLKDTTLNIATVAYYNGTTPGSRACFVCDGYEINVTINERVCQTDATWSGSPITCGMYNYLSVSFYLFVCNCEDNQRDDTDTHIYVILSKSHKLNSLCLRVFITSKTHKVALSITEDS